MPAILYAASLLAALNIQFMEGVFGGIWLPPLLLCCGLMLKKPQKDFKDEYVTFAAAAWLAAIAASVFLLSPVPSGALYGWLLAAMPLLAVCADRDSLRDMLRAALMVLLLYACGLLAQVALHVRYTQLEYHGHFALLPCWPLLDPNNAACVMNIGLIPCFYLALRKRIWFLPTLIFAAALLLTESKAGMLAAAVACFIVIWAEIGPLLIAYILWVSLFAAGVLTPFYWVRCAMALRDSIMPRLAIWQETVRLMTIHPWRGVGLGTFHYYYQMVRTETITGGGYAHNDPLQFAVEMGIPCALIFLVLCAAVALRTWRGNMVAAVTMLAVMIQACLEFQLYLQSISLLMGLALAYHIHYKKPGKYDSWHDCPARK